MAQPLGVTVSIIVPVRNEPHLQTYLEGLVGQLPSSEIIVIDTSAEVMNAALLPPSVRYFHHPEILFRAQAMNAGARLAQGKYLWFLHADCRPPEKIEEILSDAVKRQLIAATFLKSYFPSTPLLRLQNGFLNVAVQHTQRLTVGTNSLLIRTENYFQEGGFANVPLFEDILLLDRMRRRKALTVLPHRLQVSSRRYKTCWGLGRSTRNAILYVAFRAGMKPHQLVRWYG